LEQYNMIFGLSAAQGTRSTKKIVDTEVYIAESLNAYNLPPATELARSSDAPSRDLGMTSRSGTQVACVDKVQNCRYQIKQ
jgi:hypothetical protein